VSGRKDPGVKFGTALVFGVSATGRTGGTRGEKEIRKRDSREDYENRFGTNGIIVLPGASGISTEKGFHRGLLRRRY